MIGFTSVSLRSYSIEEVVDVAAKAGAQIIEWGSDRHIKTIDDAKKAKQICNEKGIIINSYGTYYRTGCGNKEQWQEICRIADAMGAKYIRTWLGTKGSAKTSEKEYALLIEDARSMADVAAEYDLIISHECHPNTYNDTEKTSLRFLRDVERDNIRTYFQSWYRDEKADKSKLINTFPYVQDVHVSFSEMKKFQMFHKKDKQFVEKILGWLKELDFCGGIIVEFVQGNNGESLIKDINRIREIWKN